MRAQRIGWMIVTVAVAGFMIACSSSATSPSTVSSVTVNGAAPAVGSAVQFTATAALSNGATQDVTNLATWQSSNTTEATVSATGIVTAVSAGNVSVTATYQNVIGTDQITIAPAP